jgi:hypothetical protein
MFENIVIFLQVSKAALDEFLSLASTSITDADVAKAK